MIDANCTSWRVTAKNATSYICYPIKLKPTMKSIHLSSVDCIISKLLHSPQQVGPQLCNH